MARQPNRKLLGKALRNLFLLGISLLYLLPLWYILNNAFKKSSFISTHPFSITPESFTFASILNAFRLMKYEIAFANSLIIVVVSCGILIVAGSLAAYGIAVINNKVLNGVYAGLVALISVPFQIAMVPLIIMLKGMHLMNSYLGTGLVYAAMLLPFAIFLYTGFMRTVPKEMLESATLDGCTLFQSYVFIYMPLLKTITGIVLVLRGVFIWNDLLIPMIVINRPALQTLPLKLYTFSQSRVGAWDMVFAGALLVCLPITIVFLAMQKTFIKGVFAGGLKG